MGGTCSMRLSGGMNMYNKVTFSLVDHIKSRGSCPGGSAVLHLVPGPGMHGAVSPGRLRGVVLNYRQGQFHPLCQRNRLDWGDVEWIHLGEHRDQCQWNRRRCLD
jgi:hypothetical protein